MVGLANGGINGTGGLFLVPVSNELGCGAGEFMLYFSVSGVVSILFLPFAGKMIKSLDTRVLLAIALLFQAGSFALFGFMNHLWGWYILAIPYSLGTVFTTKLGGPVLINNWFKKYNGLAIGIMTAATSLIGAILQPFIGKLITNLGWRNAYHIIGVLTISIGVPVILLAIRTHPQQKGLQMLGETDNVNINSDHADSLLQGVAAKRARHSLAFRCLFLYVLFATIVAAFSQYIPAYAAQLGYNTNFASQAMSFFMIGTMTGAIFFGFLCDKIGTKHTAILVSTCGIIAVLGAIFLGNSPIMFIISICLWGFSSVSVGTMAPLLTRAIFGQKEYAKIYSTITMGMSFAGIIAMPGYGFIFDMANSYIPALILVMIMLAICSISIISAFIGKKQL